MNQNKVFKFDHGIINWVIVGFVLFNSPIAAQNRTALPPPTEDNNTVEPKLKVTPSMAIVLVCLVSGFFIMGCVSVYVRQCTERRMGLSFNEPEMGIRTLRRAARGLDPALIDTFPTFVYSDVKGRKIGKTALECAVCLNEFEDDEILRLLPKCNHVFHPDCIGTWLASHITCPVCRANLVPRPGELRSVTLLSHDSGYNNPSNSETQQSSEPAPAGNEGIIIEIEPIEVANPSQTPNRNRPPRTNSWKAGITGKLPRSHSTGQLVIQPNDNCERYTLRLTDEVRSKLVNTSFNRTKSCVVFPRAQSVRKGYRSGSGETIEGKYYERFDREDQEESSRADQRGFMRIPPFFSRTNSARSESRTGRGDNLRSIPMNMFRSVRLPFDKIFGGPDKERENDNVGERSFDRFQLGGQS